MVSDWDFTVSHASHSAPSVTNSGESDASPVAAAGTTRRHGALRHHLRHGLRVNQTCNSTIRWSNPRTMASSLRRRGPPAKHDESTSEPPTPRDESPVKPGDKVKVVHHRPRQRKRKTTAIFLLGSFFGLIGAGFLAKSNDLIGFPEIGELSMDGLFDVLPAGLVKDMRDFVVSRGSLVRCAIYSTTDKRFAVEWGARLSRKLRCVFRRPQGSVRRLVRPTPDCHGSWGYLHWT